MPLPLDANTAALVPQGKHVGQRAIPVVRPATIIGARHRSHVHLLSRSVSKAHAVIIKTDHGYYVRDLASREHTYLNGRPVREADLADGDLLKIGNFVFKFQDTEPTGSRTRGMAAEAAQFVIDGAPAPVAVVERTMLIGRRAECDVSLLEQSVSTAHALLFDLDGRWFLRDLSSRTGTIVNGNKIHQEEVHFGDEIVIGETTMRLTAATDAAVAAPAQEFDELEDLIGTAPLLDQDEEFGDEPKPTSKAAAAAAAPAARREADEAPIPLDTDEDDDSLLSWDDESSSRNNTPAAPAPMDAPDEEPAENVESVAEVEPLTAEAPEPELEPESLIPLRDEPAAAPAKSAGPEHAVGSGVPAPMGVIQAERRAARPDVPAEPAVAADAIDLEHEIDLSTDPDVSGPADTTALKLSPDETQKKPAISDRVVDNADTISEGQRLLVDTDLHGNAPSDAAADLQTDADVAASDDLGELDLKGIGESGAAEATPAAEEVELEPRKGWRWRDPNATTIAPAAMDEAEAAEAEPSAVESDITASFPDEGVTPAEPTIDVTADDSDVDADDEPVGIAPVAPAKPLEAPEFAGDEPRPVDELAAMDFSDLTLPAPPVSDHPSEPEEAPDESHVVSEAEGDLNLTSLPKTAQAAEPPAEVIQPLIAPDALPLELTPTEPPKSKRGRRVGKKAAEKPAPVAEVVPPPAPVKPAKAERPQKPAKAEKPTIATVTPTPAKPGKTPRKRVTRKPPTVTPTEAEPVEEVVTSSLAPAPGEAEPVESREPAAETPTDVAEVLDLTEPTPESALNLEEMESTPVGDAPVEADALTDTSFGRQLDDFAGAGREPIVEEGAAASSATREDEALEAPETEYVADVSHAGGFEVEPEAPPAVEPERPKSALEQIAASFAASPLDEGEVEVEPAAPMKPMGIIEADEATAPHASSPPVAEDEGSSPSFELKSSEPEPPTLAPPADEQGGDVWPMPDESDLLVPADETTEAIDPGRDASSFIGGVPLPLNSAEAAAADDEAGPDLDLSELPAESELASADAAAPELELPELDLSDDEPTATTTTPPAVESPAVAPPIRPSTIGSPRAVASSAAPAPDAPTMKVPPRPKNMGRREGFTPFAKTPFDAVPDDVGGAAGQGESVPPFAGPGPATFGRITTAFDGLAMPPVRETDVFSHQVPGHAFGENGNGGGGKPPRNARPTSPLQQPPAADDGSTLGLIPETIEYASAAKAAGKAVRPTSPGFRPPAVNTDARPAAPRKRRFGLKWLLSMLAVMVLCMAGAAIGISFVPVVTPMEGYVDYNNLAKIEGPRRVEIQNQQKELVDKVRGQAAIILASNHGGISPGFLAETTEGRIEFEKVSSYFPPPGGRLIINVKSDKPADDEYRIESLLTAIGTANQSMNDTAARDKATAQAAKAALDAADRDLINKTAEYMANKGIGEARPTVEQAAALDAEAEAIAARLADATKKAEAVRAELSQLQATPIPDPSAQQEQLTAKQAELGAAQAAVADATKAADDNARAKARLEGQIAAARVATDSQLQMQQEIEQLKAKRKQAEDKYAAAQRVADEAVTVVPFVSRNVNISKQSPGDPRLLYVAGSWIAIWIVFVLLVALQFNAAGRHPEPMMAEAITDEPEAEPAVPAPNEHSEEPRPAVPV